MPPRTRNQGGVSRNHQQAEQATPRSSTKRSRDEAEETNDEPSSKRVQSEQVAGFPFNTSGNPSFRRSLNNANRRNILGTMSTPSRALSNPSRMVQSARLPSKYLNGSDYGYPELKPTDLDRTAEKKQEPSQEERKQESDRSLPRSEPQTPQGQESTPGWWGSIRRIFTRTPNTTETGEVRPQSQEMDESSQENGVEKETDAEDKAEHTTSGSSNSRPRLNLFGSPSRSKTSPLATSNFQRQRLTGSLFEPNKGSDGSKSKSREEPPDFAFKSTPGSNKRKVNTENMEAYEARNSSFGLDYDEAEDEILEHDNAAADQTLPATPMPNKQKSALTSPLKSALKSGARSTKRARFDENLRSSRTIYGNYGHAGDYTGSTFKNPLDKSNPFAADEPKSPTSLSSKKSIFDQSTREDDDWRPSAANPRPGHFCVPDFYDSDPDEDDTSNTAENVSQAAAASPPSTPRMAHAELPSTTTSNAKAPPTSKDTDHPLNETAEQRLTRARLEAQKYKPKDSSRLSSVTPARSRSSSPPSSTVDEDGNPILREPPKSVPAADTDTENAFAATTTKAATKRAPLDNTTPGSDGMTDYQREHQHDEWAQNLAWPAPQTYEDAGIVSAFISDLLKKKWNQEDEDRVHDFWTHEFDEVDRAMEHAKLRGARLELIVNDD